MKNLKKVLALALAFAMSLSLFAGAAFTDQAEIGADYADDVAMLVQLGVIGGYPDGSFKPEGNITRAETSKLIYTLKYGYDDSGKLFGGAKSVFTDVEGNANVSWAKGYINYCYNQGIVGGIGGNKFNPNGNVTVAELAKMLLVSLGADAAKEGYGGSNWSANVVADAMEFGVFDGWVGDPTAPATRELACKLMRNTIFAPTYLYNAITGIGSQVSVLDPTVENETLGEKTMGLKHVSGIVVSNERYTLGLDEEGKAVAPVGSSLASQRDKSQIYYEIENSKDTSKNGKMALLTIDVDLSDDVLGSLVDVYFKADGSVGSWANVELIGDVLVSNKTVAYDVLASDIEIMPNGESSSSRAIKPYISFTTAEGEEKRVELRNEYVDGDEDMLINNNNIRVAQNTAYDGEAFFARMWYSDVTPTSTATTLVQPAYYEVVDDKGTDDESDDEYSTVLEAAEMVDAMGENYLQTYRFVSVDGGATYSYIFRLTNMAYGKVGTYNDSTITVSGAGGTKDMDEVVINGEVSKGMNVITYMKDDMLYVEPTVTVTGKATNFNDGTATINGEIYRTALDLAKSPLKGVDIDDYFSDSKTAGKNNDSTTYVAYKNFLLEVDGTAAVGSATDYAVVLYSKYEEDTGVVTAKFGFADNTEATYEISRLASNEKISEENKYHWANNQMVGGLFRVRINNGMADLSANDSDIYAEKAGSSNDNVNVVSTGETGLLSDRIAYVKDGQFYSKKTPKGVMGDSNSIVFMLYGGALTTTGNKGDEGMRYGAVKAKALKLANIGDAAGAGEAVWAKVGDAVNAGEFAATWFGDAVTDIVNNRISLIAGVMSSGETAGAGLVDVDNIAYLLKAKEKFNVATSKWYLEVAMINQNGLINTRTVDDVTTDTGAIFDFAERANYEDSLPAGSIVVYGMTAAEEEGDTSEWILSIGTNQVGGKGLGDVESVYEYSMTDMYPDGTTLVDTGYFAVQLAVLEDDAVGFFPITHKNEEEYEPGEWAEDMYMEEADEYNFAVIAIDDNNFVEGGDAELITESDDVKAGDYNAIICVEGGKIVRIFSLYNNF